MNQPAFLLDTNIVIPLEDNKPLDKPFSEFIRLCAEHNITIRVHEASIDDIKNDSDQSRRAVTLSKIQKFMISKGVVTPEKSELEKLYGKIEKSNDHIDCKLLYAVDQIGLADFLLTQDQGIHKRAKNAGLTNKLFTLDDANDWIRRTYEPKAVVLPKVTEKYCHEIDKSDELFDTLREDYSGFDEWFKGCCKQQRKCWIIEEGNQLAGIIIWKDEPIKEIGALAQLNPKKVFKICTFKVSPAFRGERFGEQLLKQALWFAYKNKFDLCYLTVFAKKHEFLTRLIEMYGFASFSQKNGEDYYVKKFGPDKKSEIAQTPLEYLMQYYPSYKDDSGVGKFIIPIKPEFHGILFPEIKIVKQKSLFDSENAVPFGYGQSYIPGNSIRKVYLSRAPCKQLHPGNIILFYMSKDENYEYSQSITTLCVVENVERVSTLDELIKATAKRSVYPIEQLDAHIKHCTSKGKKLTVINFFVCGHFIKPVHLSELVKNKVINGHPPQQPQKISEEQYAHLSPLMELDF